MRACRELLKRSQVLLGAGMVAVNLAVPAMAWGAACTTSTLDTYFASGFNCTIDDLQFSAFRGGLNFIPPNAFRTGNGPADIQVTPQEIGGQMGFTFSNMNLSFNGGGSNTTFLLFFSVDALAGLVTNAELQLGAHAISNTSGNGKPYTQAGLGGTSDDFLTTYFGLGVGDLFSQNTASTSFAGLTHFTATSSAEAGNGSLFSAFSSVDGYTVLFSTAQIAAVPEPEIYAMLGLGLGLLGWVRRRKTLQATT